jgi:hypothetical protein
VVMTTSIHIFKYSVIIPNFCNFHNWYCLIVTLVWKPTSCIMYKNYITNKSNFIIWNVHFF